MGRGRGAAVGASLPRRVSAGLPLGPRLRGDDKKEGGSEDFPSQARGVNRRGFTLIELLVVVAIMAVLIAILLPALARARLMVKANECTRNLRHVGEALFFYAGDSRDMLPPYDQGVLTTTPARVDNCWSYALVAKGYVRVQVPSPLVCPICHPRPNVDPGNGQDHNRSYIYNDWKYIDGVPGSLRISELGGNGSGMVLVTEWPGPEAYWQVVGQPNQGVWWNAGWGLVASYVSATGERIRYLIPTHDGRSGVLFADFHAEMISAWRPGVLWKP